MAKTVSDTERTAGGSPVPDSGCVAATALTQRQPIDQQSRSEDLPTEEDPDGHPHIYGHLTYDKEV